MIYYSCKYNSWLFTHKIEITLHKEVINIINNTLRSLREKTGLNKEKFAEKIGIPWNTWISYERGYRIPRPGIMKKIMEALNVKSPDVFYPGLIKEEKKNTTQMICEYMNARSNKEFTPYDVNAIRKSIRSEYLERKSNKVNINASTSEGRKIVNEEAARLANAIIRSNKITAADVELFKRCKLYEAEDRTGTSAWGIPSAREYYGFDGKTGKELEG